MRVKPADFQDSTYAATRSATLVAHVSVDAASQLPDPEELGRGPAQHGDAVVVGEAGRGKDQIDGGLRPRVGKVGAQDDLPHSRLGDEVPHAFGREDDVVVVELADILRRLLLE